MKVFLGCDHFGFELYAQVEKWLSEKNIQFESFGSTSSSDQQSLTRFIPEVCGAVRESVENRGILICGTGIGVDIGANRFKGIRAVLAASPKLAEWSRQYDNSNVLCLSGWEYSPKEIIKTLEVWFQTAFVDPEGTQQKVLSNFDEWK